MGGGIVALLLVAQRFLAGDVAFLRPFFHGFSPIAEGDDGHFFIWLVVQYGKRVFTECHDAAAL